MSFIELINELYRNSGDSITKSFIPELVLCGTIILMLLIRLFRATERIDAFYLTLIGSCVALYLASPLEILSGAKTLEPQVVETFTGLLVYDAFSIYFRSILFLFLILFCLFTRLSGIPKRADETDFYSLLLGSVVGMCLMVSANHMLMIFLGIEMASVPSYVMVGLLRQNKKSSEAALKYAIYGAGAAGVMLYGISLLAGICNSVHLPTMAAELASIVSAAEPDSGQLMILALGGLMVFAGLGFKLSAVPFHFWAPDVFEGASAEVNAFLSIASKAAALALLVRVVVGFGVLPETEPRSISELKVAQTQKISADSNPQKGTDPQGPADSQGSVIGKELKKTGPVLAEKKADKAAALKQVRQFMLILLSIVAVITCTFGNMAAYGQTNIKRLLAYSTIAHAGYMLMAIPAALALVGENSSIAAKAIGALAIYVAIYLFMNLVAFAAVAFLRNRTGSEEIEDYAGLIKRYPAIVVAFALALFSLIGLPPLAGFIGKFAIFASLYEAYQITSGRYLLILLVAGGLNTALSLFYYLRVVKVMVIDPEPEDRVASDSQGASIESAYLWLMTLPLVVLFLSWQGLYQWAQVATGHLFH